MVNKTAFMIEFEAKEVEILQKRFKKQKWTKFISVRDYSNIHSSKIKKLDLYDLDDNIIPYHEVIADEEIQASFIDDYVINHYKSIEQYRQSCISDKATRWNVWNFTLYPSGKYESSFIWYDEANLEKLVFKAENLFSLLYYEISSCPAFYNAREEQISWQEATVIILFKSGKVQPLNVEVKTATNEIIHYSEAIEEEFGESEYQSSRQYYEETYYLMNEGELKSLYQRWNVATIHIKYGVRFDFEKHVILEWREEKA